MNEPQSQHDRAEPGARRDWGRMLRYLRSSFLHDTRPSTRLAILASLLIVVLEAVTLAASPLLFSRAVEHFALDRQSAIALWLLAGSLALLLASKLLQEMVWFLYFPAETEWLNDCQIKFLRHVLSLRFASQVAGSTGRYAAILGEGLSSLRSILSTSVTTLIPIVLEITIIVMTVGVALSLDVAAILAATIGAYVLTLFLAGEAVARRQESAVDIAIESHVSSTDLLMNVELLKVNVAEQAFIAKYAGLITRVADAFRQFFRARGLYGGLLALILVGGFAIISWVVALRYAAGVLNLGQIVLVNSFLLMLFRPLEISSFSYRDLRQSIVSLSPYLDLLDSATEATQGDRIDVPETGSLEFRNVTLTLGTSRRVLSGFSASIRPNSLNVITGPSGSGKSTATRLLVRLLSPTSGQITAGGVDIAALDVRSLRRHVSVVQQDAPILNEGLAFNIALDEEVDSQRIREVIAKCQLTDVVSRLGGDLQAPLGERGRLLSGGERQRVALARALYRMPRVIVLDEATASLDQKNEDSILDLLKSLRSDFTIVMTTHSPRIIGMADHLIEVPYLDAGSGRVETDQS